MPPGYAYNIDPNYGPVPMVTDDGKIAVAQPMIKEERLKESPSPNENPKHQSQVNLPDRIRQRLGMVFNSNWWYFAGKSYKN